MKPLSVIATGLLLVLVTARFGSFDLVADWAGWLLVLLGLRDLPRTVASRGPLLALAGLALALSVLLWVPAGREAVLHSGPELSWAANLPQLGFCLLLSWRLAEVAEERSAAFWLRLAAVGFGAAVVLPPVVFGAGAAALETTAYVVAGAALLLLVLLLLTYGGRAWALGPARSAQPGVGPAGHDKHDAADPEAGGVDR